METQKTEAETPKLSWLTRIATLLGLATKSHAMTAAEKREAAAEEFEKAVRSTFPDEVQTGNVLPLVFWPNALLKERSVPVVRFDDDLHQLVQSMGLTMYLCGGVGLSAIQVGVPLRVIVADVRTLDAKEAKFLVFVNPVILSADTPARLVEGCLSLPNLRETIERAHRVTVQAQHYTGIQFTTTLEGWAARVFLHEYDHLEGLTMLDELPPMTRRFAEKRLMKLAKSVKLDGVNGQRKAAKRAARGRGR